MQLTVHHAYLHASEAFPPPLLLPSRYTRSHVAILALCDYPASRAAQVAPKPSFSTTPLTMWCSGWLRCHVSVRVFSSEATCRSALTSASRPANLYPSPQPARANKPLHIALACPPMPTASPASATKSFRASTVRRTLIATTGQILVLLSSKRRSACGSKFGTDSAYYCTLDRATFTRSIRHMRIRSPSRSLPGSMYYGSGSSFQNVGCFLGT